jgi:hypothetical protein
MAIQQGRTASIRLFIRGYGYWNAPMLSRLPQLVGAVLACS